MKYLGSKTRVTQRVFVNKTYKIYDFVKSARSGRGVALKEV